MIKTEPSEVPADVDTEPSSTGQPIRLPAYKSKSDLVYETLRAQIVGGVLRPGHKLTVDALVRDLGVSKIPIREAMQRLESHGLVVTTAHVGAVVAPLDLHEVRGAFLARQVLEARSTRLAAEAISAAQLNTLDDLHAEMRAALRAGDLRRMSDCNARFHLTIAAATGFQVFVDLTDTLLLAIWRYRAVSPLDQNSWSRVVSEHEQIMHALHDRDPAAAESAADHHLRSQTDHESSLWEQTAAETGNSERASS